jgi:hypothetical protein
MSLPSHEQPRDNKSREDNMYRSSASVLALAAFVALAALTMTARADDARYPDWRGGWSRILTPGLAGQTVKFDHTKPWGPGQEAPLTPEYQKVLEESMADQAEGGVGNYPSVSCRAGGMPRMMSNGPPLEYVVTPDTTYILIGGDDHYRRVFTDGRDWPEEIEPTYAGYSIGRWVDEDGDGRYDMLEVETRGFKGPRSYDGTGLPLHFDNQSVFRERFYLDKADPNVLHDMITVIDHALTRPWTVDKTYRRRPTAHPDWPEYYCTENNNQVVIGKENYFLSGDGLLMPAKKGQAPPDLRHFKQTQN